MIAGRARRASAQHRDAGQEDLKAQKTGRKTPICDVRACPSKRNKKYMNPLILLVFWLIKRIMQKRG